MDPIQYFPKRVNNKTCSINKGGDITFPYTVLEKAGWLNASEISPLVIPGLSTCVFGLTKVFSDGFPLRRTSSAAKSSRNFRCTQLLKDLLPYDAELPLRGITPYFLKHQDYQVAWVLKEPEWMTELFREVKIQQVSPDVDGFYELLNANRQIVRIGEGNIRERMRKHFQTEEIRQTVEYFRYYALKNEKARLIMQEIRFAIYGGIPLLNKRRI